MFFRSKAVSAQRPGAAAATAGRACCESPGGWRWSRWRSTSTLVLGSYDKADPGWSHSIDSQIITNAGGRSRRLDRRSAAVPVRALGLLVGGVPAVRDLVGLPAHRSRPAPATDAPSGSPAPGSSRCCSPAAASRRCACTACRRRCRCSPAACSARWPARRWTAGSGLHRRRRCCCCSSPPSASACSAGCPGWRWRSGSGAWIERGWACGARRAGKRRATGVSASRPRSAARSWSRRRRRSSTSTCRSTSSRRSWRSPSPSASSASSRSRCSRICPTRRCRRCICSTSRGRTSRCCRPTRWSTPRA